MGVRRACGGGGGGGVLGLHSFRGGTKGRGCGWGRREGRTMKCVAETCLVSTRMQLHILTRLCWYHDGPLVAACRPEKSLPACANSAKIKQQALVIFAHTSTLLNLQLNPDISLDIMVSHSNTHTSLGAYMSCAEAAQQTDLLFCCSVFQQTCFCDSRSQQRKGPKAHVFAMRSCQSSAAAFRTCTPLPHKFAEYIRNSSVS